MKIKFSLKHTTDIPEATLVSTELIDDQMYIDLKLVDALALIVDGHIKWSWCGDGIEPFNYSLSEYQMYGERFSEFPKGSVITFIQTKGLHD